MRMRDAVNLDDLRRLAKRRLPRSAFDFIDGGVCGEDCLERNRAAFRRHTLTPRYLVDVETRDQSATLFGRTYASPFGISPAGAGGMFWPDADRILAEVAAETGIPFVLSAAAGISIEEAMRLAPETTWFQVYGTRDPRIADDQARRAAGCGVHVLVFTVDVPVVPRRERNLRNRFSRPIRLTPARIVEGLTHPSWLCGFLRGGGIPPLPNWSAYAPEGAGKDEIADLFGRNTPASGQDWSALDRLRRLWGGALVVKGVLHPDDARRAAEAGADGLIVSNHGGRQLDCAPSPVEMLAPIRAAVRDAVTVMIDSGVRRGADVLVARCLGAAFAFLARPTMFGVAAAGREGVRKAIGILRAEIDLTMGQIGCPRLDGLGPDWLTESVIARRADPS